MNNQATGLSEGVPHDVIFSLAADSHRRTLIRVLSTHDRELTLNDLTKEIVDREFDMDITEVPGEEVLRVATSLYHNHIPRLEDAGIVRFNATRKLVEPTPKLQPMASFLTASHC